MNSHYCKSLSSVKRCSPILSPLCNANDFTDNQIDLVRAPNKRPRTFDQTSPSHTTPSKQEREIISSAQKHVFATTDATDDES